jgi:hypothetical protein
MEIGIWLFVAFFAVGIGLTLLRIWVQKKRTKDITHWAVSHNYNFIGIPDDYFIDRLQMKIFQKGHSQTASNLVEGRNGSIIWKMFDFSYTTGGGRHRKTQYQQVFLITLKNSLPNFTLGSENFFTRVGEIFGLKDIDFPYSPNFSKKYLLKGTMNLQSGQFLHRMCLMYLKGWIRI